MEREGAAKEPCRMRTPRRKRRLAFVFFSNSQNDHGMASTAAATERGRHRARRGDGRELAISSRVTTPLSLSTILSLGER
jgi:hypothetical protein